MLLGVITGCNFFSFLSKVESPTADRIDWTTFQGRVDDPYPLDVWVEGTTGATRCVSITRAHEPSSRT
jgi:hypothetical protein